MKRPTRPFAAFAALALLVQSTGAASLPVAVLHAPGAFPPPAGRMAAYPPRAAAAAETGSSRIGAALHDWLESAGVVARALLEAPSALPSAPPAPEPPAEFRTEQVNLIAAPPAEPAQEPARDRMLVVMEPGRRVEAVLTPGDRGFTSRPEGVAESSFRPMPDFHEKWIEQDGLRARLTFKNPHGTVTGDAEGYHATFANGVSRFAPVRDLEAPYLRSFPIYWHDETVSIEMEIVNTTGRTLRHVRLEAMQETFRPVETEGRRTAPPADVAVADELAPGAHAVAHWSATLRDGTQASVNLEQTHVRISADAADSSSAATLLDAPQAGVADPPGPALTP
jgi:hypothetical protein